MVKIFLTTFQEPLNETIYDHYKSMLPVALQEKNAKFLRWQDRHSHLLGKILFQEAFKTTGLKGEVWDYIEYNAYKRPCLSVEGYDINLSHSGEYVICAIGEGIRLGIDIEKMKMVEIENFTNIMSTSQYRKIKNSPDQLLEFYKYWTFMESVVKAEGKGMFIPLDQLEIVNNTVQYDKNLWRIQEINIAEGYKSALATDRDSEFEITEINYDRR
ncbi:4'-phosphopantetheinyl transferase family protein [Flavobacteriaceae bacterium M23B6Z8]